MQSSVAEHSILKTVLAVETTEKKSERAVEQETTDEDHRGKLAERRKRCGQMTCGKEQSGYDIRYDEDLLRHLLSALTKDLEDQKRDKRHKEESQQQFLDDSSVKDRGNNAVGCHSRGCAIFDTVDHTSKGPRVEAENNSADQRGDHRDGKRTLFKPERLDESELSCENIAEDFTCYKPVAPYENLFDGISESKKNTIINSLTALKNALDKAISEKDPLTASNYMIDQFGTRFPKGEPLEEAKAANNYTRTSVPGVLLHDGRSA